MSNEKQIQSFITSLETDNFPATLAGHYIAGEWGFPEDATSEVSSICPSTGITLASSCANKHDVQNAINCAYEFHLSGQHNDFDARIERVSRFKEAFKSKLSLITRVATREQGKPLWEATHEINESLEYMDWVSKNGDFIKAQLIGPARLGHLTAEFRQKPAGVTAAYLPFSTTISTFCFYYVASLLSNCPMVMFSSKHNLLQAQLLSSIIASTGEDPAAFQMILSGFSEFRQALSDRRVAAVLYTGSRDHCDEIRDDSSSFPERRLILQSGGKNTAIIDESADMQLAVNMVLTGAFRSSGQLCSSTHRVAIHESRFEEFKTMTRKALREMEVGPTHLPDYNPFMGPLYSEKAVERYLRYQTMAAREADESITWGKLSTPEKSEEGKGFFVKPCVYTLLKEVNNTDTVLPEVCNPFVPRPCCIQIH